MRNSGGERGMASGSGEFKRGWPIVLSSAVGIGMGLSPLPFYTIGVFVGPMSKPIADGGLGLTPEQIMLALPIYTLGALVMSPIIGLLSDRIGVRWVALTSMILFGLSMIALGLNDGSMTMYAATWAVMAIAGAGTLPITFTRAVNGWFQVNRGVALGVALIATGLYGTLAKILAQEVTSGRIADLLGPQFAWIEGWRLGYAAVALIPLLIAFPITLVAFRDIGDKPARDAVTTRFKPILSGVALIGALFLSIAALSFVWPQIQANGPRLELVTAASFAVLGVVPFVFFFFANLSNTAAEKADGTKLTASPVYGLTLKQALMDWRFWLLAVAFVPISFAIGGPIPNVELALGDKGFAPAEAVGLAAIVGLAVIAGRLVGGFLIDRFWAPGVACVFLAAPAAALWILGEPTVSREMATVAIFLIGFGAGVEYDFMAYLVARYFGTRSYGAIYGSLYGFFAIGAGFGPPMFAKAIRGDAAETFAFFHAAAIVLILSSAILLFLGRYRKFEDAPEGGH